MDETSAPLPSQLSTTDDSPYITIKSPTCCKYNFPKAIHDIVSDKISNEEENNDSSGYNDVKKCFLSNCCNNDSSEAKDILVDKDGNLVNWGVAKASHPIPSTCNLYYFEVKILNDGKTKEIEIGIALGFRDYTTNVGHHGLGYRGNDGKLYKLSAGNPGEEYGPTFGKDDVIGFGFNLQTKKLFFTKNGMIINLTNLRFNDNQNLFPAVSLHSKNAKVEINFGEDLFLFDICK